MRTRSFLTSITILAMIFVSPGFALSEEEGSVSSQVATELPFQLETLLDVSLVPAESQTIPCDQIITCSANRCGPVADCQDYPHSKWVDLAQEAIQACINSANRECASRGCGPAQIGRVSGSSTSCSDGQLCVGVEIPYTCSSSGSQQQ